MSLIIESFEFRCKLHPKYKGLKEPFATNKDKSGYCLDCWRIWNLATSYRDFNKRFSATQDLIRKP